jgi:predicted transcriptional regulator
MKALFVFSGILKMYLPESNSMTMVGSVSEVTVLRTLADQFIVAALDGEEWKDLRRILYIQSLLRQDRPCSIQPKGRR